MAPFKSIQEKHLLPRDVSIPESTTTPSASQGRFSGWPFRRNSDDKMGDNRTLDELQSDGICFTLLEGQKFMNREENRLETFKSWPESAPIEKNKLAKAGFYYTGDGFKVQCFSCKGIIEDWDFGDQAIQKHISLNPGCLFVQQRSDNIPLNGYTSLPIGALISNPSTSTNNQQATTQQPPQNRPRPNCLAANLSRPSTASEKTWESFGKLVSEEERLKTYKGWPLNSYVKPADLAKAGFFYLKDRDRVQCIFCRGIVGDWEAGDVPITEHHRHFPNCPFIKGYNVHNVPKQDEGHPQVNSPPFAQPESAGDVTGIYRHEMEMLSQPEKGYMTSKKLSSLGINNHKAPVHPSYSSYEARLKSFENWPDSIPQKPEALAEAGLYYAGVSDHVRCFCCDGGLRNWEAHDDPWIEHARWFGKCCFVTLMKGHDFVEECKIQHPPILPSVNREKVAPIGRQVSESELDILINTPIVRAVVDMGFDLNLIRNALKKRLDQTGSSFPEVDSLVDACMDLQHNVERRSSVNIPTTSTSEKANQMPRSATTICIKSPLDQLKTPDEMSIEDENRLLKEMRMCKICMDEEIGVVFLPCGHLLSCPKCAPSLKDCPMCRKEIRGTVRTFLS